jgi:hypothetical protein
LGEKQNSDHSPTISKKNATHDEWFKNLTHNGLKSQRGSLRSAV